MQYCIYLRKSRADLEAESHGEGETLARHEKILTDTAKRLQLNITRIYKEIVSGDTIAARPVMQQLLNEIEQKIWSGVLVVEVERLARGDTIDQGIIANAFKCSNTKIITPTKIYDPNNEFDEEYFEFGLFMSRREYKAINRRLQRGREAAAKEGKFIGSIAPFGYERVKLENSKGYSLKTVPENAKIIKMIFDWYVNGFTEPNGETKRLGIRQIAKKLNELKISPVRHDYWQKSTVRDILLNPVYVGKIRWKWRKCIKSSDGKITIKTPQAKYYEDCIIADGLHDAIIDSDTFEKAQEMLSKNPPTPVGHKNSVKNPLAGLLICGKCGRKLVLRKASSPNKSDYLVCHARECDNVSTPYHYVEERILKIMQTWLCKYDITLKDAKKSDVEYDALTESINKYKSEIATLQKQLNSAFDFFEQKIYSSELFTERTEILTQRINEAKKNLHEASLNLASLSECERVKKKFIPKVMNLLDVYNKLENPALKNLMLKEIIADCIYIKNTRGCFRDTSPEDFELILFPNLPKS